jgi:hypothetical protein
MPPNLYIIVCICDESKLIGHSERNKHRTKTEQQKKIPQDDEQNNNVTFRWRKTKTIIT